MQGVHMGRWYKSQTLTAAFIGLLIISSLIVNLLFPPLAKANEISSGLGSLSISSYQYALTPGPPTDDCSLYKSLDSNQPFTQRLSVQDIAANLHLQGQFLDGPGSLHSCASNFYCSYEKASGRFYQLADIPPPSYSTTF
jgi:hypothetical protein